MAQQSSSSNRSLDRLYELKIQKLKEQKVVSDQMNDILSRQGGLNDMSRYTCKNLQAAIAVSKMPGYFEYYHTPEELKKIEEKKVLNTLAKNIQNLHTQLEEINNEIHQLETQSSSSSPPPSAVPTGTIRSINEWFDIYGKPSLTDEKKDLMTSFTHDTKMYGGTHMFSSFKSSSTVMRKGRITR